VIPSRKGQAFLALILLIGGVVAMIGITIAFLAGSFVDSGFGYQAEAQAAGAATSGAEDALLQLDRNSNFATSSYSLAVGSTTAVISVTQGAPSANFVTVLSAATVSSHTQKINVVLSRNAFTGQMTVVSWQAIQ
jgi:uncharacterized protein (UPF0333 family)